MFGANSLRQPLLAVHASEGSSSDIVINVELTEINRTSAATKKYQAKKPLLELKALLALMKACVNKRKFVVSLPMLLAMAGAAIAIVNSYCKYNNINQQLNDKNEILANTYNSLQLASLNLQNETSYLLSQLSSPGTYNVSCYTGPQQTNLNSTIFLNPCSNRLDTHRGCYDNWNPVIKNIKEIFQPPWYPWRNPLNCRYQIKIDDTSNCHELITNYCKKDDDLSSLKQQLTNTKNSMADLKNNFYDWIGGSFLCFLLFAGGLGECAPLAVILMILLTNVVSNRFSSVPYLSINKEEKEKLIHYRLNPNDPYTKTIKNIESKIEPVEKSIKEINQQSVAFLLCVHRKKINLPVTILQEILRMIGSREKLLRTLIHTPDEITHFELGSIERNRFVRAEAQQNPIYAFFKRLKHEKCGQIEKKNVTPFSRYHYHPVTEEKYRNEELAYNSKDVLKTIYEYSGLRKIK